MLNFRKWWSKKSNAGHAALPLRLEILEDRYLLSGTGTISGSLSGCLNSFSGPGPYYDGTISGGLSGTFTAWSDFVANTKTNGAAGFYHAGGSVGSNAFSNSGYYTINLGADNTFNGNFNFDGPASDGENISGSGTVSGTYDPSTYDVVSGTFIGVLNENAIALTNPGTQNNNEGDSVTLPISASDSTGATITYAATGLPAGLQINPSTGVITGTVGVGAAVNSTTTATIVASDGTYTAQQSFTWNVASPITLANPGTQTSVEGTSPTLALSATDSTGGTLSYAASGLPNGLKINTSTGVISGTVAPGDAAAGPYSVTVTAQDNTYSANQTFTWNINSPVTMAVLPDQTAYEGATVSAPVSATDSSGGTLAYTAGGLPPGVSINTSTGTMSGTIAAGAAADGPYTVTVVAGDGTYSASQTFTWNVNDPITIVTPADQTNNEGSSASLTVSASDFYSGTLTYGALGLPSGLSINAANGAIGGTVAIGDAANGPYTVTLLAEDGTYSAQTSFTWNINNQITLTQPDDQTNNEGDTVSGLAVLATNSGSGTLSYAAAGLPNGLSINASTGVISGTISYAGSWQPTVTVSAGTDTTSASFNWDVSGPISITAPGDQNFNAGDAVSVQVVATDTGSGTLSYAASGLPSGLSIDSSSGLISGTLSSSLSTGVDTTTLTVSDGTNTTLQTFTWTITPASDLVLTNPGTQNSVEGNSPTLTLSDTYSGTGTVIFLANGLPPGLTLDPTTGVINGTVSAGDSLFGPYSVTVTATDGTNTDSQIFTWNISSPITLTLPADQTTNEGAPGSLTLSASYSGSGTLSYSALGLPPGLLLNPTTGVISGTVAVQDAADGPYYVTVQAAAGAYVADQSFTWNVNSPITLTQPADQTTNEGSSASLALIATDSSGGTLSYAALGLPEGLQINATTGVISGTVAAGAAAYGPYAVTVIAQDGTYSTMQFFTWNINSPITLTQPADQTTNEGSSASLTLSATDSSGGTLSYSAMGLPTGLVINPTTGVISGTVAVGDALDGPYSVTVGAADGTYSTTQTFNWNINSPITITIPDDQTTNAGTAVTVAILASDAASGTFSYTASDLPTGLSISSSTGVISGTVSTGGSWQPTIGVSDGTYSDSISFNWAVSSPINITDDGDQNNIVGDTVSVAITATDNGPGTLTFSASGLPGGLAINSSTGLITGTVATGDDADSPYTATITVTDGTNTAIDTFAWTISPAGTVVMTNPGSQTNAAGDLVALSMQATDTAGNVVSYTASGLPDGLYLNPDTGLLFGTVAADAVSSSPYSVTVTATDGTGSASETFSWTINAAGPVTLANPGDQTTNEGGSVSIALSATDSSSGTLSFAAYSLPAGLQINASTGTITGTVAAGDAANGPYTVTLVANDGTNSASQSFNWTVNSPITLAQPADQTNNEGDSVSLSLSASDGSGGTLSYAALGLPSGLKINPSTGVITGTVAVGDAANGPYSVTIVAGDGTYSTSQTFNWNINSPITITTPADQTNNDGDTVSLTISATDSSSTPTYSAQGLPPGLSINRSTGAITGTVTVGDSSIGTFEPTIIVSDGTYSASTNFEWDVNGTLTINDPGDQANVVGDTVSLPISVTDTSSGTLTFAASGLPTGLSINTTTGVISGTVSSGATAIGSFVTTIQVSDGTNVATDTFNWTVTATGSVTLTTPSNQTDTEGSSVSLSLIATDSGIGTLEYFAEGLPPGVTINPSTGAITGTVAVNDAAYGPYSVTVIATDGSNSAQETFTWTVNSPVSIDSVAAQTYSEGDSISLSLTSTDTSGGTLTYGAVGLPAGFQINTSTGTITGTAAIGDAAGGAYTVTVFAADGTYSTAQNITVMVNGQIALLQPPNQATVEGNAVDLTVSATDASGGTLNYAATGLPAGLSINQSTGAITGTIAAGAAAYGPYTVTVTASDNTYSASQTFTWNVSSPITITDPAIPEFSVGADVELQIQASSSLGGSLTYQALGLPGGLSIDSATGEITGTITSGPTAVGNFASTVIVTEGPYSTQISISWTILAPELGFVKFQQPKETDKITVAGSIVPLAKISDNKNYGDFLVQNVVGKGFKPQTTKNKEISVQAKKTDTGYSLVYSLALGLTTKNATGNNVVQLVNKVQDDLDAEGKPIKDKTDTQNFLEVFPLDKDGAAYDPRGTVLSIPFKDGPNAVRVVATTTARIGKYNNKLYDVFDVPERKDATWKNFMAAPNSGEVKIVITVTLNKDGTWTLVSKELNLDETGTIK
jgi:hypothetical protein